MGLLGAHARLAGEVAAFLMSLHSIDSASIDGVLDVRSARSELARVRTVTNQTLACALSPEAYDTVVDWWETSGRRVGEWPAKSLVHGDFWGGNIIVDETLESLRGVIDFAEAHIGDPAEDFATLFHAGPRFTSGVLRAYTRQRPQVCLDSLVERASWWWELRELQGLARGLDARQGALIDDSLAKLRHGPLFDPGVVFAAVFGGGVGAPAVTPTRCEATR